MSSREWLWRCAAACVWAWAAAAAACGAPLVLLATVPRSGTTLLRHVFEQALGARSFAVYREGGEPEAAWPGVWRSAGLRHRGRPRAPAAACAPAALLKAHYPFDRAHALPPHSAQRAVAVLRSVREPLANYGALRDYRAFHAVARFDTFVRAWAAHHAYWDARVPRNASVLFAFDALVRAPVATVRAVFARVPPLAAAAARVTAAAVPPIVRSERARLLGSCARGVFAVAAHVNVSVAEFRAAVAHRRVRAVLARHADLLPPLPCL